MKSVNGMRVWILALLLLLGACASGGNFEEPFDEPDMWDLTSDASAETRIAEGRLFVHVFLPGQVAWTSLDRSFEDFRLSVDATQVSGPADNEYGVLLRMDEDSRFYAFSISGDGYVRVARYEDATWNILGSDWTASPAVNQGESTNVLEVTADGSLFTFSVNGQQVAQVEDETLRRGSVGLYAGAFGEGDVVVAFDNLLITPLP